MIIKNKANNSVLNQVGLIPANIINFGQIKSLMKSENSEKIFLSECLLLTNSKLDKFDNLIDWIYYNKNIIKFDSIKIVHNNCDDIKSRTVLKSICDYFNINYYYEEKGSQELIFNKYQAISNAKWLICIDEDEYIYLKDLSTINDLLVNYDNYKLSFCMINFYSKNLLDDFDNYQYSLPEIFNYCDNKNITLNNESKIYYSKNFFKTFVNNNYSAFIFNTKNDKFNYINLKTPISQQLSFPAITNNVYAKNKTFSISTVHNPLMIDNDYVQTSYNLTDNQYYYDMGTDSCMNIMENNVKYFICHFKYQTTKLYNNKIKYNKFLDVSNNYYNSYQQNLLYNIYDNSILFDKFDGLKNIFINIVKEIYIIKQKFKNI